MASAPDRSMPATTSAAVEGASKPDPIGCCGLAMPRRYGLVPASTIRPWTAAWSGHEQPGRGIVRLTKEVLDGMHGRLAKEVVPAHRRRAGPRPLAAAPALLDGAGVDGADGSLPERLLGRDDLVDYAFLERAIAAGSPVGRLVMDGNGTTEFATGFLVSPRVLMTNQHVLPDRETAERGRAEFDVTVDATSRIHPGVAFALDPATFFVNDAGLDVALVAVQPTSIDGRHQLAEFGYLKLVAQTGKIQVGEAVTIIQHPHHDPRMIALRENQLTKFL